MTRRSAYRVISDKTDDTSIQALSSALDAYPAAFQGNPLNLLFLNDARPIRSAREFLCDMEGIELREERREYLIGAITDWPFPAVSVARRPDHWQLSERLFERFDTVREVVQTQRDIGPELCRRAARTDADVVALLIVDGLSYYDLPDTPEILPCLVDGVTITKYGFREVVGKPPVSQRLFAMGYRQQQGFTYFDVASNELAGNLFDLFASAQVTRIARFEDCLDYMTPMRFPRGYVQITAPGLDRLCHHHHDQPPRAQYLHRILDNFDALTEKLSEGGRKVVTCLTADHGILWRDALPDGGSVVESPTPEDVYHPRYFKGGLIREYAHVYACQGQTFSLFRTPYLTRPLKHTEWGVHGGISAWESLVPLIFRTC